MRVGERYVSFRSDIGDPSFVRRFPGIMEWAAVVRVENEFVKIMFCPRFGGLYAMLLDRSRADEILREMGFIKDQKHSAAVGEDEG